MIDLDFIRRCNDIFEEEGNANYEKRKKSINDWNENNREKLRSLQKIYNQSEKGKIANKRKMSVRHARIREQSNLLSLEELEEIRIFYVNCPPEYHVDHIYPISKGGRHHISNLQYLLAQENRKKHNKVI